MYNKLLASIAEHQEVCNTTEISANGGNEDLVYFFIFFNLFCHTNKNRIGYFFLLFL